MAPGNAKTKLEKARALIGGLKPVSHAELKDHKLEAPPEAKTWQEMMRDLTGVDVTVCPQCGQGRLIRVLVNHGESGLAPPIWDSS